MGLIKGFSAISYWTGNLDERRISMKEEFSGSWMWTESGSPSHSFSMLVALPAARIPQSPAHWDLTVRGTQSWEDVLMTPLATWGGIFSPRVSTESLKSLEFVEAKSGRPAENLIRHSLPMRPVFAFTSFNSKLLLMLLLS